jgi:dimeric dUTPase (all-alpha-NTP-PPase superfamily)
MKFQKMIHSIDAGSLAEPDILLRQLRSKLPRIYTDKNLTAYCEAFRDVLSIGLKLEYAPMMLYLPARPKALESLVVQFQQINIAIATRENRQDWFHELFALFLGMAGILALSWQDIEDCIAASAQPPAHA